MEVNNRDDKIINGRKYIMSYSITKTDNMKFTTNDAIEIYLEELANYDTDSLKVTVYGIRDNGQRVKIHNNDNILIFKKSKRPRFVCIDVTIYILL